MITERDLQEAIAECQGVRNPDAHTCVMLAAFLTIQRELYGQQITRPEALTYSGAAAPSIGTADKIIEYTSGTEFSRAIHGKTPAAVWPVIDELMTTLRQLYRRLYNATLDELSEL